VWKWLRQDSKAFYAAGFDALVKRLDKCIDVGGGMSRNKCTFQVRISPFVTYLLTLPHIKKQIRIYASDQRKTLFWNMEQGTYPHFGTARLNGLLSI
jgi:hypothetical protein